LGSQTHKQNGPLGGV